MRHNIKYTALAGLLVLSLIGCSSKDDNTEQIEESIETVESSEETVEKVDNTDKNNKKDKVSTEATESNTVELENTGVVIETPESIELEEMPETSGRVVDTYFDFSIYGFSDVDDNNISNEVSLYDGNAEKFLYELNDYIVKLCGLSMIRLTRYVDEDRYLENYGITVEDDISNMQILLEALDTKNTIIQTYFADDIELVNDWNNFYNAITDIREDISNLTRANITELDTSSVLEYSSTLSELLSLRTTDYDPLAESVITQSETVESTDTEE